MTDRQIKNRKSALLCLVAAFALTAVQAADARHESASSASMQSNSMPAQSPILVTTTTSIEGYRITKYLGVVRGLTVRQPTVGQSLKANFKSIVGGKIGPFVSMCETAREQAYQLLIERAQQLGANAVVGMRYDSSAFSSDNTEMASEVVCYGTAVIIEPAPEVHQTAFSR